MLDTLSMHHPISLFGLRSVCVRISAIKRNWFVPGFFHCITITTSLPTCGTPLDTQFRTPRDLLVGVPNHVVFNYLINFNTLVNSVNIS